MDRLRLVTDRVDFVVIDKKTEEDITRSILLQVIAEQEHQGEPMMSEDFLSQVIRAYGGAMQGFVGSYLEQSLKLFMAQQQLVARLNQVLQLAPGHVEASAGLERVLSSKWRTPAPN